MSVAFLSDEAMRQFNELPDSSKEVVYGGDTRAEQVKTARRMLSRWEYVHQHGDHMYCSNTKFWRES